MACWGERAARQLALSDPLAVPVRRGLREDGANDAGDAEDEGANVHSLVRTNDEGTLHVVSERLQRFSRTRGAAHTRQPRDAKAVLRAYTSSRARRPRTRPDRLHRHPRLGRLERSCAHRPVRRRRSRGRLGQRAQHPDGFACWVPRRSASEAAAGCGQRNPPLGGEFELLVVFELTLPFTPRPRAPRWTDQKTLESS